MEIASLGLITAIVVLLFSLLWFLLSRYKKCPSDKVMVIYGNVGQNNDGTSRSAKCIHGGAAFIWPVFQSYSFLDLKPISIECNLTNALSKQNIRVDIPSRFTVGISTEAENMTNAAERLLGLSLDSIQELARDILFGQLRLVIATMDIEEINSDRDKFLLNVSQNVEQELRKIGLKLINVNVTDIRDESGYLEALRQRCSQTKTLLIFDEVQTGFGRTGALFAFQKYGVVPDILCLAKALGGGMPLGAIVTGVDLMKAWQSEPALGHITTFGGHPICCAAGMAALELILAQNLSEEAEEKGQWFRELLAGQKRIVEMRGTGLLWACCLSCEEEAKDFVRLAAQEGIISDRFLFCGTAFRISPPLTISFQEIDEACALIIKTLERL